MSSVMPVKTLSVIIPSLNEGNSLRVNLQRLQVLRSCGYEIILVEAGECRLNSDEKAELCDLVFQSERGRAKQMNLGAKFASGKWLVFLHADTHLPADFELIISKTLSNSSFLWGWFGVSFDADGLTYSVIAKLMNVRARLTSVSTGDQTLVVNRKFFRELKGFSDIPIMEDIELTSRLRRYAKPQVISGFVTTSARRWQKEGVLRTIVLMWSLRFLYFIGISPRKLVNYYYKA
ncbi:MAG: TIGR04283 family arsenosugar biosynthesis glycosyltransferase [Gammaproteobacteria bacterium]|nr:TIGR04283 family arsenosugar biosynthesis glycosyltransferase [Gammaproteobacteria bacterium]